MFTPFFRKASQLLVKKPEKNPHKNYYYGKAVGDRRALLQELLSQYSNPSIFSHGGRSNGIKILRGISSFRFYANLRNYPAKEATTILSPHHKFGTISIRESYHAVADALGTRHPLINELYWRDFFTHVSHNFPRVFGESFNRRYADLEWHGGKAHFEAWKNGKTGFPIVDAGMRQLNQTGFMHNRVRMIVASFLTKDLHVDWRDGERYFAQKLIDYDPCVNNGNWQWSASTGCDAQPYFRIFNPWLQQKRFDPQCEYIKKWVPELSMFSAKEIHALGTQGVPRPEGYPAPIVSHSHESSIAKAMFRKMK
jgi:deoxyribodipyrimidine photo-lyase